MITEPRLEVRPKQPYVAIRTQVAIPFGAVLPKLWAEVETWLAHRDGGTADIPIIRYYTTDMSTKLDLDVGFMVPSALPGEGRITAGFLPAGRYAVLTYTGPYRGKGLVKASAALLEWAAKNHLTWQNFTIDGAEWWGGRAEFYLTGPNQGPDSKKWQTELAFLTAEA